MFNLTKLQEYKLLRTRGSGSVIIAYIIRYVNRYRYINDGLVGEGNFGQVFLCHLNSGLQKQQKFALKLMHCNLDNKNNVYNIKQEQGANRIVMKLRCDHIIKIFDDYESIVNGDYCYYIIMERADMSLSSVIKHHRQQHTIFKPKQILDYFHQILKGLKVCHDQNFMHADIKASNILIFNILQKQILKICDFSTSNQLINSRCIKNEGTEPYMSPEIILGRSTGISTDIWSVGHVLYEMITLQNLDEENQEYKTIMKFDLECLNKGAMDLISKVKKEKQIQFNIESHLKEVMKIKSVLTSNFKCLLQDMLVFNPSQRKTVNQLLGSSIFMMLWPFNFKTIQKNCIRKRLQIIGPWKNDTSAKAGRIIYCLKNGIEYDIGDSVVCCENPSDLIDQYYIVYRQNDSQLYEYLEASQSLQELEFRIHFTSEQLFVKQFESHSLGEILWPMTNMRYRGLLHCCRPIGVGVLQDENIMRKNKDGKEQQKFYTIVSQDLPHDKYIAIMTSVYDMESGQLYTLAYKTGELKKACNYSLKFKYQIQKNMYIEQWKNCCAGCIIFPNITYQVDIYQDSPFGICRYQGEFIVFCLKVNQCNRVYKRGIINSLNLENGKIEPVGEQPYVLYFNSNQSYLDQFDKPQNGQIEWVNGNRYEGEIMRDVPCGTGTLYIKTNNSRNSGFFWCTAQFSFSVRIIALINGQITEYDLSSCDFYCGHSYLVNRIVDRGGYLYLQQFIKSQQCEIEWPKGRYYLYKGTLKNGVPYGEGELSYIDLNNVHTKCKFAFVKNNYSHVNCVTARNIVTGMIFQFNYETSELSNKLTYRINYENEREYMQKGFYALHKQDDNNSYQVVYDSFVTKHEYMLRMQLTFQGINTFNRIPKTAKNEQFGYDGKIMWFNGNCFEGNILELRPHLKGVLTTKINGSFEKKNVSIYHDIACCIDTGIVYEFNIIDGTLTKKFDFILSFPTEQDYIDQYVNIRGCVGEIEWINGNLYYGNIRFNFPFSQGILNYKSLQFSSDHLAYDLQNRIVNEIDYTNGNLERKYNYTVEYDKQLLINMDDFQINADETISGDDATLRWPNGSVYKGEVYQYVPHGRGILNGVRYYFFRGIFAFSEVSTQICYYSNGIIKNDDTFIINLELNKKLSQHKLSQHQFYLVGQILQEMRCAFPDIKMSITIGCQVYVDFATIKKQYRFKCELKQKDRFLLPSMNLQLQIEYDARSFLVQNGQMQHIDSGRVFKYETSRSEIIEIMSPKTETKVEQQQQQQQQIEQHKMIPQVHQQQQQQQQNEKTDDNNLAPIINASLYTANQTNSPVVQQHQQMNKAKRRSCVSDDKRISQQNRGRCNGM